MNNFKHNEISITDYEGSGPPLIFIHAFPLCNRMWDEQVNYFKDRFRVISYDARGLGYSNEIRSHQFTMEDHVNDLFDVMDHLKLQKVNACGLSMGGYILLRALVREQSRFNTAVLAGTKSEGESNESLILRSGHLAQVRSGKKDWFLDEMLKRLISEESYGNEEIRSRVRTILGWMNEIGICANILAIATRTNTFYQLRDIKIPTLVVVGRKDMMTPVIHSFYLKENLPDAEFEVIEGAGHLCNIDKPSEFNAALEKFLLKTLNNNQ